ncbi:MAG: hypothetical protein COT43_02705 [Candidatus Marinimicrobia bacterium CG08_land_8_20_14_0_20_45_22]|nr:MAG: hypothetical protein COT43_02705 [Candidatus Marinimicrobia bacterium CG08_land_8_20_14_0_20_45_22]
MVFLRNSDNFAVEIELMNALRIKKMHQTPTQNRQLPLLIVLLMVLPFSKMMSSTHKKQEALVQSALQEMYQMNYAAANQLFRKVGQNEPFHPMAPLGTIATQWLAEQESMGFSSGNRQLLKNIDTAESEYKSQIRLHPENTQISFYYGTTLGLRARILLGEKNWGGVLISGYNAIRHIKKAEKHNPELWDIQLPFGVFNYYVGVSSGYMKIASWIFNESGSKEDGLRQMTIAAEKSRYAKYEARGILSFVYLYMEDDPAAGLKYAQILLNEFPNNPYYHFLCAEAYLNLRQFVTAEKHIREIRKLLPELKDKTKNEYELKLHLLNGTLAFHRGDLNTAEKELKSVIDNYYLEMDMHLGFALLRLGQINDLQGRRNAAIILYRKTADLDNRTTACKEAKLYLARPYSR